MQGRSAPQRQVGQDATGTPADPGTPRDPRRPDQVAYRVWMYGENTSTPSPGWSRRMAIAARSPSSP